MNERSCVENVRYFYLNGEYKEDIYDMICQINHLNIEK